MTHYRHPIFSLTLVGLQFGSLAYLLFIWFRVEPTLTTLFWTLPGILLGLKAIHDMHLHNLHILPDPDQHAQLIQTGLYRWIRHPMYLSVLLFALPFALALNSVQAWSIWLVLLGTLLVKLHYEEHLLQQVFPQYSVYRQGTRKLLPFIY